MEANRAAGDNKPSDKLTNPLRIETESYNMNCSGDLRCASFITEEEWENWRLSTPKNGNFAANYLADGGRHRACRVSLLRAISSRVVNLYSEWYNNLSVGDLFTATDVENQIH
jgi:hypothetical protein